ncbi:unnamed protein product [Cyprideis torosa]|uniref:Uncharacterized protein n=1 Tax=Cyprideis torosa TaxID=163714 RepID=A0A7R8W9T2_9CRUS|nr:unnamed protein product [Cyprideis torosa]CAG0884643.1 unnamed protein product [Cyprideis torosa]
MSVSLCVLRLEVADHATAPNITEGSVPPDNTSQMKSGEHTSAAVGGSGSQAVDEFERRAKGKREFRQISVETVVPQLEVNVGDDANVSRRGARKKPPRTHSLPPRETMLSKM